MTLPMQLPAAANATLPARYEAAKVALAECEQIDECKEWADKTAALASYARQADDKELENHAMRIRARAIRRCGELLREVEAAKTGPKPETSSVGTPPPNSGRFAAAERAGMSRDQAVTALRVANVPKEEFEAAVESADPPTVTELAERGKNSKPLVDLGERTPEQFRIATQLLGQARDFAAYLSSVDIAAASRGCNERERERLSADLRTITNTIDRVLSKLEGQS